MFIEAQNSEEENKISLFSEIINLDETLKKEFIHIKEMKKCLIYLEKVLN